MRNAESLLFTVALGSACSLAPISPTDSAASVGRHNTKIDTLLAPGFSIGATYGAGENVDIGFNVEQAYLVRAWGRYSLRNEPDGFSVALAGGAFAEDSVHEASGVYGELLMSHAISPTLTLAAGYRLSSVNYTAGDYRSIDYELPVDNDVDLSETSQFHASMAVRVKSHLQYTLGALCQEHLNNTDPGITTRKCRPVVGLAFFSR